MDARQQGQALANEYGDSAAFHKIDRYRRGGADEAERIRLQGIPHDQLSQVDRYLEGRLSGAAAVPLAAAFEASKPVIKMLPEAVQGYLPEAFQYKEGVTSPASMANVMATAQGAWDSGRIVPYHIANALGYRPNPNAQAEALEQRYVPRR